MSMSVVVTGAKGVEKALVARADRIHARQNAAAQAGAKALVPFVKAAIPRRKGYQRSHVKVYPTGQPGVFKVKLTGHEAHLIYGDTKAHEIDPRGLEDAQVHGIRSHHRIQGPIQLKEALFIPGSPHPVARTRRPAHRGAPNPLPAVLAEHRTEAALAAMEVIRE